jgi:adenine-specific DNA-methyltransferase
LIDPYFDEDDMVALVDKYNHEPAFNPENVVLFGYSFTFTETEMIKKNLATMKDTAKNKKNIHIRY